MTARLHPLLPSLALCVVAQLACDAQVGPDYQGEPLGTVQGQVTTRSGGGAPSDVAVLWFSATADAECAGPAPSCSFGGGGTIPDEGGPSPVEACWDSCPLPAECSAEAADVWQLCVESCEGDVTAHHDVGWDICANTAIGEMVEVEGEFPAAFTLDLFQPAPASAMLASADGDSVAVGFLIAVNPDAGPIEFDFESDGPPAGILGGAEGHMLIYAGGPIAADSDWGQTLGGSYDAGFHVVAVVEGETECDGQGACWTTEDSFAPAPDDLDTELELVLGAFDEIDWPHL